MLIPLWKLSNRLSTSSSSSAFSFVLSLQRKGAIAAIYSIGGDGGGLGGGGACSSSFNSSGSSEDSCNGIYTRKKAIHDITCPSYQ